MVTVINRVFTSTVAVGDPSYSLKYGYWNSILSSRGLEKSLESWADDQCRNCQAEDSTVLLCGIARILFQHGNPIQQPKMRGHEHRIAQRNDTRF